MRPKYYVGVKIGREREVFKSIHTPTEETHGKIYVYTIGPFRTKRGATYMATYQDGSNPHLQHVDDAEYYAAREVA
jgi:hypothetical protein